LPTTQNPKTAAAIASAPPLPSLLAIAAASRSRQTQAYDQDTTKLCRRNLPPHQNTHVKIKIKTAAAASGF
jgi:hypothetical protein